MADTRRRRIPVWLELVLLLVLLALAAWGLRVGYIRYMRSAYPVEYEAYVRRMRRNTSCRHLFCMR